MTSAPSFCRFSAISDLCFCRDSTKTVTEDRQFCKPLLSLQRHDLAEFRQELTVAP
jgi:hypothetical protein